MDKYLLLVNKQHHFDPLMLDDFEMLPIIDEDGESYIEKQTLEAFFEMSEYIRNTYDFEVGITSAGRTIQRQKDVYKQIEARHGEQYAENHVAKPGTSEHHTGLAIDVNVHQVRPKFIKKIIDKSRIAKRYFDTREIESGKRDEMFHLLHNIMTDYGFILRYPKGKKDITGFDHERWHIRYVGKEHAEKIRYRGLTLEEYVKNLELGRTPVDLSTFGE
jgi:LAS superfamily LD-carboxypeptidase LdcB